VNIFILIVIALTTNGQSSNRPVSFTQEFNDQRACEMAKEKIDNSSKLSITFTACTPKSSGTAIVGK
jgi:hypothetical protein